MLVTTAYKMTSTVFLRGVITLCCSYSLLLAMACGSHTGGQWTTPEKEVSHGRILSGNFSMLKHMVVTRFMPKNLLLQFIQTFLIDALD